MPDTQNAFWYDFLSFLSKSPKNMVGQSLAIPVGLNSPDYGAMNKIIYDLSNKILLGGVETDQILKFFSKYKDWVSGLSSKTDTTTPDCNQTDPHSAYSKALAAARSQDDTVITAYKTSVCKVVSDTCIDTSDMYNKNCANLAPLPIHLGNNGNSADLNFAKKMTKKFISAYCKDKDYDYDDYLNSGSFMKWFNGALQATTTDYNLRLAAFDKIANKCGGPNYGALQDTKVTALPSAEAQEQNLYNMFIDRQGAKLFVPSWDYDDASLISFIDTINKGGSSGHSSFTFSQETSKKDSSNWHFNGDASYSWFVSVSASGSKETTDMAGTKFTGSLAFDQIIGIRVTPGNWFNDDLIAVSNSFNSNDPEAKKAFVSYPSTFYFGFKPDLKISFTDWSSSHVKSEWSASTSVGIGPFSFNLGNAAGGEVHDSGKITDNGIEFKPNDTLPRLLAYEVSYFPFPNHAASLISESNFDHTLALAALQNPTDNLSPVLESGYSTESLCVLGLFAIGLVGAYYAYNNGYGDSSTEPLIRNNVDVDYGSITT